MKKMQFGVMLRGVFPQGDDMRTRFAELMEQARAMEKLGYDSLTKGSHFSTFPMQEMVQIPFLSRVMAGAAQAARGGGEFRDDGPDVRRQDDLRLRARLP